MKLFACPHCGRRLYFENVRCLNCGSDVLYQPEQAEFVLRRGHAACANADQCGCNWSVGREGAFCRACELNKTIPDLSVAGNVERWTRVEAAKKRAVYTLLAFQLPVGPKRSPQDEGGIAFDFLSDGGGQGPGGERVLTGHDNGLITLNVAEADSSEREKMRAQMGENYRTLLGHFRHELGHYYWDRLIRDDPDWLPRFRDVFGDEQRDYAEALEEHYANGTPPDWQLRNISAYAASHPWEDWAETWAHFLHISDTLEMALSLNLQLDDLRTVQDNEAPDAGDVPNRLPGTAATGDPFDDLLARWMVLSEASNSINRCMGLPDLYPFVISPVVASKLRFVHDLLSTKRSAAS